MVYKEVHCLILVSLTHVANDVLSNLLVQLLVDNVSLEAGSLVAEVFNKFRVVDWGINIGDISGDFYLNVDLLLDGLEERVVVLGKEQNVLSTLASAARPSRPVDEAVYLPAAQLNYNIDVVDV